MGWFCDRRQRVWRELSEEIGAGYVEGRWLRGDKVQAGSGPWTITLDKYTESDGHSGQEYTRMRAPYVNPDGFRFTVYRKGVFTELGKLFGMQDIEVGDPEFDEAFVVKSNDEGRVRTLLADAGLRRLIEAQPKVKLKVKDSEGWFGPTFPADVDELHFQVPGVIKDKPRLKDLFELFAATLDRLHKIGSAPRVDPGVRL
jgi:hypothetical protein